MAKSGVIATIFAGLLSSALAAPLSTRSQSGSYSNTTTASSSSYNGPIIQYSQPAATIFPDYTSQYNAKTGAVDFDTSRGHVYRSPSDGGADISTLVTFTLDAQYASNMCQLVFDLVDPTSWASGSAQAQLFTSLAPATTDASTWPSGNLRNQDLGSIDIVPGGRATWEAGTGLGATANGFFPCNAIAGQIYGGEVVPQSDAVEVSWPAGSDGVKIIVY